MLIEAVISGLIYLALLVLVVYLIQWVLGVLGISIPDQVMKIIWLVVALVAILVLIRTVLPPLGVRLVHTPLHMELPLPNNQA